MGMTRKPDEIKKGLECCKLHFGGMYTDCSHCPYYLTSAQCDLDMHDDALALIQQLQDENAQLNRCIENMTDKLNAMNDEVAKLQAERDAAVTDLSQCTASHCPYCKHWDRPESAIVCINCRNGAPRCKQHFEWRGVTKEE
jgi:hypothetical protein